MELETYRRIYKVWNFFYKTDERFAKRKLCGRVFFVVDCEREKKESRNHPAKCIIHGGGGGGGPRGFMAHPNAGVNSRKLMQLAHVWFAVCGRKWEREGGKSNRCISIANFLQFEIHIESNRIESKFRPSKETIFTMLGFQSSRIYRVLLSRSKQSQLH